MTGRKQRDFPQGTLAGFLRFGNVGGVVDAIGGGGSREGWRDLLCRWPAQQLAAWRGRERITREDACKQLGVSMRMWGGAEQGRCADDAWMLLGALRGGPMQDATSSRKDIVSECVAQRTAVTMRENRMWRRVLKTARETGGRTIEEIESGVGIRGLQAIEWRMPDDGDLLWGRLSMLCTAYFDNGWDDVVKYCYRGDRHEIENEYASARLKLFDGDAYFLCGMLGMSPAQWMRWEGGLFYSVEEKTAAEAALWALSSQSRCVALSAQMEKEAPLSERMRTYRRASGKGTADDAIARLIKDGGTQEGDAVAAKRIGGRKHLRCATHHWMILENGCAPTHSDHGGLKSVGMGFMKGSEWTAYYNQSVRVRP